MAGLTPKIEDATAKISRDDLACPDCEYSLRGLPGDVVNCPECGRRCDLAALMTRTWRGPWYKAPDFNLVVNPVASAGLGLLALGVIMAITQSRGGVAGRFAGHAFGALYVIFWGWLLYQVWKRWPGPRGLILSLLAHVLLAGYFCSVFAIIAGVASVSSLVIYGPDRRSHMLNEVVRQFVTVLLGMVVFWLCRRGERYIAGQCIRRYLRLPSVSA